jgi:hypothetical protein
MALFLRVTITSRSICLALVWQYFHKRKKLIIDHERIMNTLTLKLFFSTSVKPTSHLLSLSIKRHKLNCGNVS